MRETSIVVGAGAGGLVAALYLQQAGHDVLLLEAKSRVGGCASSFPMKDFTFLAGATTLIGLEPEMPLGRVLRELNITFEAPVAERNLRVWHDGRETTLSRDAASNRQALAQCYSPALARFWDAGVRLGARGWGLVTRLRFPPRGPVDLLSVAATGPAWGLLPSLVKSTANALGDASTREKELIDELLLVSTQARAHQTPWLFGALGVEYLQRPFYLPAGGLAAVPALLAKTFVERGGRLELDTRVTRVTRGFELATTRGAHSARNVVLDLTHWDAAALVDPAGGAGFERTARRHPDSWAAFVLYVGVRDVFGDAAPYHQLILRAPMPATGTRGLFVTLSRPDDRTMAPEGYRALTVSCHTAAADWAALDDAAHAARRQRAQEEVLGALAQAFPGFAAADKPVVLPGTPRTWEGFTGRRAGRVGGLAFSFETLLRGYPTGRSGVPRLVRVGDTVFPGQSVPACAWGARRVVCELLGAGAH